jgi:NAD(P)H-dependent FMN reductase
VALHLTAALAEGTGHTTDLLDLTGLELEFVREVPLKPEAATPVQAEYLARLKAADAVVFVSPEYNGGFSAALKHFTDWVHPSYFRGKVIGVSAVSDGPAAAMRAALQLQNLVLALFAYPVPYMLTVGLAPQRFDEEGALLEATFGKNVLRFKTDFLWLAEAVQAKKHAAVAAASADWKP